MPCRPVLRGGMVQIAVLFDARAEWLCRAARVFVVGECDVS